MADLFTIGSTDISKVTAAFEALPAELRERIAVKIKPLIDGMLARAEANEPHKTGALREATDKFFYSAKSSIGGGVKIGPEHGERFNLKAAALEYGSHKRIDVAGHDMRLNHFMDKQIEPMTVFVKEHDRRTNIIALHFMRDALRAQHSAFVELVEEAVSETVGDFNA